MNEHAIPVLIAFLALAGVAALLLRQAFSTLSDRPTTREAAPVPARRTVQ
ncbi:hypothetical protein [Stutzerimonas stutzeri]|nr:hypothetical protein [Stutzerimonas stutzeri]MCQ4248928.1 hypothetical protein [Stutzerimonas stutzeri]QUE74515.1 hypothetical protein KCX70_14695 [Stutzerimonas stutzeri]